LTIQRKTIPEWLLGKLDAEPGVCLTATESGWINTAVFEAWFEKFVLFTDTLRAKDTKDEEYIALCFDGHSAHFSVQVIDVAIGRKILIICFPSNCTHILQPLDSFGFGPSCTRSR